LRCRADGAVGGAARAAGADDRVSVLALSPDEAAELERAGVPRLC